jgi:hypothetical protein
VELGPEGGGPADIQRTGSNLALAPEDYIPNHLDAFGKPSVPVYQGVYAVDDEVISPQATHFPAFFPNSSPAIVNKDRFPLRIVVVLEVKIRWFRHLAQYLPY